LALRLRLTKKDFFCQQDEERFLSTIGSEKGVIGYFFPHLALT
jgi:hypothetical protein